MLNDLLAIPEYVEGLGYIYPVTMDKFTEFCNYSWLLRYDKRHTDKKNKEDLSNLEAILFERIVKDEVLSKMKPMDEIKYKNICIRELLKIVLKEENIEFIASKNIFYINYKDGKGKGILCPENYDFFRKVVMRQNIIFEEKIYLSPIIEQAMKDAREVREKGASKITLESMISTISSVESKHYWDLMNYTYYQILMNYSRIRKLKDSEASIIYAANQFKVSVIDFGEEIDLNRHPDESLKKSGKSLSKLSDTLN